jgi:hypothetical protein
MRADNKKPTTSRLYAELLNESSSEKIDDNDNGVEGKKSRSVKWRLTTTSNQNTIV